jgi:hypothetical protein
MSVRRQHLLNVCTLSAPVSGMPVCCSDEWASRRARAYEPIHLIVIVIFFE